MYKKYIKYSLVAILNFILLLFSYLFYKKGGSFILPLFLISQAILVVINIVASKSKKSFALLTGCLAVSTIYANIVDASLYYHNISSDSETLLVGQAEAIIGVIYILILSVIAYIIKRVICKIAERNALKKNSK